MKTIIKLDCSKLHVDRIYLTTDYDGLLANKNASNRDLSSCNVNKLALNIIENNQISPVILDPNGVIIDGQHRAIACKEIGIPVRFFIASNIKNSEDAQTAVNAAMKLWVEKDYIKSGIEQNLPGYCFTKQIMHTYDVNGSALASIRILPLAVRKIKDLSTPIEYALSKKEVLNTLNEYQIVRTAYLEIFSSKGLSRFNRAFGYVNTGLKPEIKNFSWQYIADHLKHTKTDPNFRNIPRTCRSERDFINYFGAAFNFKKNEKNKNHLFFQGRLTK